MTIAIDAEEKHPNPFRGLVKRAADDSLLSRPDLGEACQFNLLAAAAGSPVLPAEVTASDCSSPGQAQGKQHVPVADAVYFDQLTHAPNEWKLFLIALCNTRFLADVVEHLSCICCLFKPSAAFIISHEANPGWHRLASNRRSRLFQRTAAVLQMSRHCLACFQCSKVFFIVQRWDARCSFDMHGMPFLMQFRP